MYNTRAFFAIILCFALLACDSDPQAEALYERWPKHDWSKNRPEIYLDINNDGKKERALIGFGERTILVAVYLQDDVNWMDFAEIFINKPSQQNAICGSKATLEIEPQNYSLIEQFGADPEGFKSCQDCQGLLLRDEKGCDPFHLYWDHQNQMLSWWRN